MSSSDSELNDSDVELQNAFAEGRIKPGLNIIQTNVKEFVNNEDGLKQKLQEFKMHATWIESLDCLNQIAPLAPELAAQMLAQEQKRESQLKNNKKLKQFNSEEDPVLNDFKREMLFHRQGQAAVVEFIPKIKSFGILTKRPDDYFAEMAKTDDHMQKIRESLMKKQEQQKRSERMKHLRTQRKEGKILQTQAKLHRQHEKKEMLDQLKKVRKGVSKDLDFLDGKKNHLSKKALEKKRVKDKKFGFGGKKKGSKTNTKDSASEISEYRNMKKPPTSNKHVKGKGSQSRLGKNRRMKNKAKTRR